MHRAPPRVRRFCLPLRGHTSSVVSSAKRDLAVYMTRDAIEGRWEPWRWPSCCLRELATVLLPRGGCYEVSQLGIAQSRVSWPRYSYKETTGQETLAAVFKHQHLLGLQKPFSDIPVLSSPFKGAPLDTSGNSAAPAPAAAQWLNAAYLQGACLAFSLERFFKFHLTFTCCRV